MSCGKIKFTVLACEFPRVGHALCRLRDARCVAAHEHGECDGECAGRFLGETIVERAAGFFGADVHLAHKQDVAGVEALIHIHHGDAGLFIASLDGRLNRCRAAPAREKGGVQIEAREIGGFEHVLW